MNSFSQDKEFELISILLKKINIDLNNIFVCEFGAWDGYRFSNVVSFGLENHCGVIFIEGDKNKFKILKRNFDDKPNFYLVNSFVNFYGSNKIEDIIRRVKNNNSLLKEKKLGVLSIDIDGDDYHIFSTLDYLRPAIICIEYNPTIPNDTEYINPKGYSHGSSPFSLYQLAKSKNYSLFAQTKTNLIFFDNNLSGTENVKAKYLVRKETNARFFFGYDGSLIRSVHNINQTPEIFKVPWSPWFTGQPVPSIFRKFLSNNFYSRFFPKYLSLLIRFLLNPFSLLKKLISSIRD